MSGVNVPLLRKVVEWVEEQEKLTENREWYQAWYISAKPTTAHCGTAFCVAGKVALDEGWEPEWDGNGAAYVRRSGHVAFVTEVAAATLGIASWNGVGEHLFAPANTAADVRRIAEDLAGERL